LLGNYYLSDDLERQIDAFIEHYNHARYHGSIDNLTPADVTSAGPRHSSPSVNASSVPTSQTAACSISCRLKL
jgi:hypothetical protein